MKLKTILLLASALLPLAGHADEYDNRARAAAEEAQAERRATVVARSYQIQSFAINKLNRFVSQHGGLVEDGTCNVRVPACRGEDQVLCQWREDATVAFSALNPSALYWISTCSLNLRDGLACRVYESYNWGKGVSSTWYASCYDADRQQREFNLGAGIGMPGKAAAKPAAKKRKK